MHPSIAHPLPHVPPNVVHVEQASLTPTSRDINRKDFCREPGYLRSASSESMSRSEQKSERSLLPITPVVRLTALDVKRLRASPPVEAREMSQGLEEIRPQRRRRRESVAPGRGQIDGETYTWKHIAGLTRSLEGTLHVKNLPLEFNGEGHLATS